MQQRIKSSVVLILAIWMTFGSVMIAAPAMAQTDVDVEQAVTRSIIDLMRAEGEQDYDRVYDFMAPESRNLIPRQAFINSRLDGDTLIPTSAPEIQSITIGDWEYEVTGGDYTNVATVIFTVEGEVDGSSELRQIEINLMNDGLVWRWFYPGDENEIDEIASGDTFTIDYETPYSSEMFRQIDMYWAQMFANAGLEYTPPVDIVGVRVERIQTGCGIEQDIELMAVYYCTLDETIYYDPGFRDAVVEDMGEYAWSHVIAHEWGHHIQSLLGFTTSRDPELYGGQYTIESELQADCLAGMFTQDAYARGLIRSRDVSGAEQLSDSAGDMRGTRWDDEMAHGTGPQRVESFWTGFDDGLRGCHVRLETNE